MMKAKKRIIVFLFVPFIALGVLFSSPALPAAGNEDKEAACGNFEDCFNIAMEQFSEGKVEYPEIIESFSRAISFNPQCVECYMKRGLYYQFEHEYDKSAQDYKRVMELEPGSYEPREELAKLYGYNMEEYNLAVEYITKAIELAPMDEFANYDRLYESRANFYEALGEYGKALEDVEAAISRNAYNSDYHYYKGNLLVALGENEAAVEAFGKAIEAFPDKFGVEERYNRRGTAYLNLNDYKKAEGDFLKALEINGGFHEAFFNLGRMYQMQGDYNRAIEEYTKAIEVNSYYAFALNERGICYRMLEDLEKASDDFTRAYEIDSADPIYSYNLACIYSLKGDIENAVTFLQYSADIGYSNVESAETDGDLVNLRADSRFGDILERIKSNAKQ